MSLELKNPIQLIYLMSVWLNCYGKPLGLDSQDFCTQVVLGDGYPVNPKRGH